MAAVACAGVYKSLQCIWVDDSFNISNGFPLLLETSQVQIVTQLSDVERQQTAAHLTDRSEEKKKKVTVDCEEEAMNI